MDECAHASLVRTTPLRGFPLAMWTAGERGAAVRGFYRPLHQQSQKAVLLTRKWDFQEEETGSENEVTC